MERQQKRKIATGKREKVARKSNSQTIQEIVNNRKMKLTAEKKKQIQERKKLCNGKVEDKKKMKK